MSSRGDSGMSIRQLIQSIRRHRWLGNAAFIALLAIVYFGVRAWQQHTLVEGPAPALRAATLNGAVFDLGAPRDRPVLVYFWATWCAVCRLEQGAIEAVAADHPVVGVALQSGSAAEVTKYMNEQGLQVAVINDPDGHIARAWGVRVTPTHFIVDARGEIRFRETGYTSELGTRARLWWAQ